MPADGMPYDPAEPGFSAGIQGFAKQQIMEHYLAVLKEQGR